MKFSDFIPSGFTDDQFLILSASLTVFVIFFTVWYSLLYKDPSSKKAGEMAKLRDNMRDTYLTPTRRKKITPNTTDFMKQVVEFFKLLKNDQAEKYALLLSQAGKRTPEDLYRYLFAKLVSPILVAFLAYLYIYVLKAVDFPDSVRILL